MSLQIEWQSSLPINFTTNCIVAGHYIIFETEFHFVMECPALEDLKSCLFLF